MDGFTLVPARIAGVAKVTNYPCARRRTDIKSDTDRRNCLKFVLVASVAPALTLGVSPSAPRAVAQSATLMEAAHQNKLILLLRARGVRGGLDASGLPPEKWSSLMYGLWPDGGLKNAEEETHG